MKTNAYGQKRRGVFTALFLVLSAAAALYLAHAGHGIPCVFRMITGWRCPGCGITTLFLSLLHGDISAAFLANPFLFCTLPLLAVLYPLAQHGPQNNLFRKALPAAYLVALLVFGIIRNVSA